MGTDAKHVIDFDHHGPKLRDHNTEQLEELMYNEAGCPMGWSKAYDGFWAIWGYDALYDAVQDAELFASGLPKHIPPMQYTSPLIPIDIDGPIQQEYRKLVLTGSTPVTPRRWRPGSTRSAPR